jgi:hypothetical protein
VEIFDGFKGSKLNLLSALNGMFVDKLTVMTHNFYIIKSLNPVDEPIE